MGTRTSWQTLEAVEFGTEVEGFVRSGNIAPPEYLLTGFEELGSNFSIPCWEASRQEWDLTKRKTQSVAC